MKRLFSLSSLALLGSGMTTLFYVVRRRPFLLACVASVLIAGLFLPRAALASGITFDPTSFGVGVCFRCGVDPITGTNFQSGIMMTSASGNPIGFGSYTLQANLNDTNHGGLPTVGALLTNTGGNGGVALLADGFSMTGASSIAHYTITGNFTITNPPSNDSEVIIKVGSYADFLNCKNTPGCTSPPLGSGALVDIVVSNTPIFKVFSG
jgi:hypothetical protein